MLSVIKKIYAIFTPSDRRQTVLLFFPMVIAAIINVLGIAFVAPFIAIASNPEAIHSHQKIAWLYQALHFSNTHTFLLFLGFMVLTVLILGNSISALTTWLMLKFINLRSFSLSKRLLENYLRQPYEFFLNQNSTILTKNILSEVDLVVARIIRQMLEMTTKLIAVFFIILLLFLVNPILALSIMALFGGSYMGIYALVRRHLGEVDHAQMQAKEQRYRCTSETLGGIKDIKLRGTEHVFLEAFSKPAACFSKHEATAQIIAELPRFALEIVAFGGMLLIVLYLLAAHRDFNNVMPLMALYAFAGYRLMPGLQSVFGALTSIRAHAHALDTLYNDFIQMTPPLSIDNINNDQKPLVLRKKFDLKDITFHYPQTTREVLKNISISITAGESIGIVGETGSGKTTIVDIILGLLEPTEGTIIVDGKVLTNNHYRAWQKNLGYVPQYIYLSDETIINNIAFGIPNNEIDFEAVQTAAKMAAIHEFIIHELPEGYHATVGERGVRLSGGQRQRLGIARALYLKPDVLVFDEATSALDSVTEEHIMKSIYQLSGKKTLIIVAHRLSTLLNCDKIIVLQNGVVQDVGSYHALISRNTDFQRLANL